jgi:hypothetical protein
VGDNRDIADEFRILGHVLTFGFLIY